jgi:hypothetical protein
VAEFRHVKLRTLALGLALIAASQPIQAKCVFKRYLIIISAFDGTTQLGVPGASVTLFANDEAEAWPPDYVSTEPILTDANGAVSGTFYFHTASGSFFGMDSCRRKLKKLEVVVTHEGYRSARIVVNAAKAVTSSTPAKVTLRIPAVMLEPLK